RFFRSSSSFFFFHFQSISFLFTLSLHDALPIYTLSLLNRSSDPPSYVSPAYHLLEGFPFIQEPPSGDLQERVLIRHHDYDQKAVLEGFPFIQEPPSGDLQERVLIRHHDYDQCFQSVQLLQWNSQVKFNVTVYRNLPTTRDSIMTS